MSRPRTPCWLLLLSSLAGVAALLGSAQAQTGGGKKYALLVGAREYDSVKFSGLNYTENDAEELADVLEKAGFAVRVLTTSRGARRKEDLPTAANLRAEIQVLLAGKKRSDTVLVALAGHGMQGSVKEGGTEKNESFFCPCDTQLNDTSTLIGLTRLFADLDACGAGVKLLLVDACRNEPGARGFRNLDTDTVPRPARGIAALFSCSSGQRAFETEKLGPRGHGVFFHFVLEGLRGKAKNSDNEVTWAQLADFVTRSVSRTVPRLVGNGARQTPHEIKNLEGESPVLIALAGESAAETLFRRGLRLYFGQGEPRDAVAAAGQFRQAADQGHALAAAALALLHRWNDGVVRDDDESARLARRSQGEVAEAARRGRVEAHWILGGLYQWGLGVARDDREALNWFRQAASRKDPFAQFLLGSMVQVGLGVRRDEAEALRLYHQAAEQGSPFAQDAIGLMHQAGQGVKRDDVEALRWYRKAAAQKYAPGLNHLGQMHLFGLGVPKDGAEARRCFLESAAQGYAPAQANLGEIYFNGRDVPRDDAEALSWFQKAAAQHLPYAQSALGLLYYDGRGVTRDYAEAERWARKAAAQNDPVGQCTLGFMHELGHGVPKDNAEAARWYRLAAEQNNASAQHRLGLMHEEGPGVQKDRSEALRWFRKAAAGGNQQAADALRRLGE
jgi:TPR repeat protein